MSAHDTHSRHLSPPQGSPSAPKGVRNGRPAPSAGPSTAGASPSSVGPRPNRLRPNPFVREAQSQASIVPPLRMQSPPPVLPPPPPPIQRAPPPPPPELAPPPPPPTPPPPPPPASTSAELLVACPIPECKRKFSKVDSLNQHTSNAHYSQSLEIATVLGTFTVSGTKGRKFACPVRPQICRVELSLEAGFKHHVTQCATAANRVSPPVAPEARADLWARLSGSPTSVLQQAHHPVVPPVGSSPMSPPAPWLPTTPLWAPNSFGPWYSFEGRAEVMSIRATERAAAERIAAVVATTHAAEVDALETKRRALEAQLAVLQSTLSRAQSGNVESAKKIDKLEKRLALSATESDKLRQELAVQKRGQEQKAVEYTQKEGALAARQKVLDQDSKAVADLRAELKGAKEFKAELTVVRASEAELKKSLAAREGDLKTLQGKLDQSMTDSTTLKAKLAAICADTGVGSSSLARPPKRPLPADAADASASSAGRPSKKPASAPKPPALPPQTDPRWTAGLKGNAPQKAAFKRHWVDELVPQQAAGRICSLCAQAAPPKTHPIYLGPKDLASGASVTKALLEHLAGEHEDRWTAICDGLADVDG